MDTLLTIGLGNAVLACLLALAAAAVSLFGRRPALAHGLWLLVLLKLVTPPLVQLDLPLPPRASEPSAAAAEPAPNPPPVVMVVDPEQIPLLEAPALDVPVGDTDEPLAVPIPESTGATTSPLPETDAVRPADWTLLPAAWFGIWAAGSVAWLGLTVVRVRQFRRLLRHARPAPAELVHQVDDLSRRLGLARPPEVLLVPGPVSPMVWGLFGSPRLLVPSELIDRLDAVQLATLLAHELAHLRRRDHWVRLLELIATGLYWWNPVVWFARKAIREAEEECCDAWVVWLLPDAAKSYAMALVETVIFLTDAVAVPPAASGVGAFPILKRRLTMIMRGTRPRSLSAVGVLGVLSLGLALLPWAPSWAQDERENPKPAVQRKEVQVEVQDKREAPKPEEIEKAAQEAKKAAEELKRARAHLHEVEKRFMEAQRRLAGLAGGDGKTIVIMRGDLPPPPPPGGVRLEGRAVGVRVDGAPSDPKAAEELAALTAQLKAKEAQVREAELRLEEAKRRLEIVRKLHDKQAVAIEEVEAATAQVKIMEAQLQAKKAELEEIRVRLDAAKKRVAEAGHFGADDGERAKILLHRLQAPVPPVPVPPGAGNDRRLQDVERKLAELLKEVQGLRQEIGQPATRPAPGTAPPVRPVVPTPPPPPRNP